MAWKNYSYLRLVRGLQPSEFRVLSFLVDEADLNGRIEALQTRTIGVECEMASNSVFRILKGLQGKKFIKSRTNRFQPWGAQISNGYQLDLGRYYPAGETNGLKIWRGILRGLGSAAEIHAEQSEAYFTEKTHNLAVWIDGGTRDVNYFQRFVLKQLLAAGRAHSPTIRYFDFLIKLPTRTLI